MRSILVIISLTLFTSEAAADDVARAPDRGLDPDLAARLDGADSLVAAAQLERALIDVLLRDPRRDPFTAAQRERFEPRVVRILGDIGKRARAAGDVTLAARAYDARWTITRGRDPELARALLAWSEREPAGPQALYLARRARAADPDLVAAVRRDAQLSSNRRAWPGRLMILAGALAFAGGLYAQRDDREALATGLYVAAPMLSTSGILLMLSGVRRYAPASPRELPVLRQSSSRPAHERTRTPVSRTPRSAR
jgi:hypothetical protein